MRRCANHQGSGYVGAGSRGARNFEAVEAVLLREGVFVWVLEARPSFAELSACRKWRLGAGLGVCVGALAWFTEERHVARVCGDSVLHYVGSVPSGEAPGCRLAPPWWRGCAGAPKKKQGFRGGDPRAAVAKSLANRRELAEERARAAETAADAGHGPPEPHQAETVSQQRRQSARLQARVHADAAQGAAVVEQVPAESEVLPAVHEQERSTEGLLKWARQLLEDSSQADDGESDVASIAEAVGGKRRRYGEIPADAWRQFTPTVIDDERCLARVRNCGKGGQCRRRRVAGRDLCYDHSCQASLKYGRVTGPIPEKELRWLLREAEKSQENVVRRALRQKASEREQGAAQCAGSAQPELAAPERVARQRRRLYMRSLM